MAEANSTFMPKAIPLRDTGGVSLEGYGWRTYTLATEAGKLVVEELRHCRTITGSVSALEAYGLLKPDWLPGIPGNNARRQTVVFAPSGPWLIYGNRGNRKPRFPYIAITRASARQYVVEQNYTDEERAIMEAFYDEQWSRKRIEAKEKAGTEGGQPFLAGRPKSALEWKEFRLAEIDLLLRRLAGDEELAEVLGDKFRFGDSTQLRIQSCIDQLRSTILGGGVVARQPRRDGNVVYLPAAPWKRPESND